LTVAGHSFTVNQSGNNPCSFSISPTGKVFTNTGGTSSVTVTATSGCDWTATSSAAWISIISGAGGTGNGSVTYSVAQNTSGVSRTGTVTIAGKIFTVKQQP
jgi:hypothetical protein